MNRKFWTLGILAAMCFFGCSEDDGNSTSTSGNSCNNNGVLDAGEVCDGDKFVEGKRVCPEGKVLAEGKTEADIKCSDKCALVTEGVCIDAEETKTCGNKKLDEGEVCDGDKFAEGKRVCPEGKVLAEGKTEADITCSDKCALVTEGVCVDAEETKTCGNGKLDEGEVCDGDKFAEGKRVCPEWAELVEGKTEADITCTNKCTLDTREACHGDLLEKCDGTKYCLCNPDGTDCSCEDCMDNEKLETGNLITCEESDGSATCVEAKCTYDAKDQDRYVCIGNYVAMCLPLIGGNPDGRYAVQEGCEQKGMVCKQDASTATCVAAP